MVRIVYRRRKLRRGDLERQRVQNSGNNELSGFVSDSNRPINANQPVPISNKKLPVVGQNIGGQNSSASINNQSDPVYHNPGFPSSNHGFTPEYNPNSNLGPPVNPQYNPEAISRNPIGYIIPVPNGTVSHSDL